MSKTIKITRNSNVPCQTSVGQISTQAENVNLLLKAFKHGGDLEPYSENMTPEEFAEWQCDRYSCSKIGKALRAEDKKRRKEKTCARNIKKILKNQMRQLRKGRFSFGVPVSRYRTV